MLSLFFRRDMTAKILLRLFFSLVFAASVWSIDLDSLIIKSLGGQEALEKIKSLKNYRVIGKINWNGLKGNYKGQFKSPNKIKLTADFGSFSIVQGFDGTTVWQKDLHGRVYDLAGFEKKEFMRSVYVMSFAYALPGRLRENIQYGEIVEDDSMAFHEVFFHPSPDDTITVLFDVAEELQRTQFSWLDNLLVQTEIEDYRSIGGLLIPFHTISKGANTPILTEIILDSVVFDSNPDTTNFTKPTIILDDYSFPADSVSLTIPFKFYNGHVYVTAKINGVKKGWFILDTGASATYYHAEFTKGTLLKNVGEIPSMGLGGYQQMQLVGLDSLEIGNLVMYHQTAGVMPLEGFAAQSLDPANFGGILGYDFFMRFPVLFDFKKQELTVFNPRKFALPPNGHECPLRLTMMIPSITAQINGVTGQFIIDMGSAFGLIIHQKFGETLVKESIITADSTSTQAIQGIGAGVTARNIPIRNLQIGAYNINIPEAVLAESSEGLTGSWEIAGNIGTEVLEQYGLLFDYPNSRVVFYDMVNPVSK